MTAASPRRRALVVAGLAPAWLGAPALRAAAPPRLVVAAYPLLDAVVRDALPRWRERHPELAVHIVSRQYGDHHTAMTTALSTAVGLPDVMALESSYVGRFAQGRGLDDLLRPPYDAGRLRGQWVPYAVEQALNGRGELVAAPTDIGPGTLLLRTDLLARAGVAETELTRSWESYVAAGVRIRATTGAYLVSNAQAVKDIVIRSGLQPGEGLYFGRGGQVLVESARFRRAFALAQQVRRQRLDARVNAWSNEWAEGFKRGTLATELSGAWMAGQMANWVAPATRGLWRAAPLPADTYVGYGGSYYAIPRLSDPARKALAWELVQLLTLDRERQLAAFRSQDAFPALRAAQDDAFFDEPLPFLGGQPARRLWRDSALRIAARPMHKQDNFADEVVGTELDNVLDRGKDIDRALADAARLLARRAHR
jgi:multiple sugar transport system substrate-binding protein